MATQRDRRPRSTSTPRRQRSSEPLDQVLAELAQEVDSLITENRELRRMRDRYSGQAAGLDTTASRTLRSLHRRLTKRRAEVPAARPIARRRKITDPAMLERRRQALAKARAVRSAQRALTDQAS